MEGLGADWTSVINNAISNASNILGARYAVPQLNAGQYIRNSQGVMYQNQAGDNTIFSDVSNLTASGSSSTLMLLAAGVVVILLISRK